MVHKKVSNTGDNKNNWESYLFDKTKLFFYNTIVIPSKKNATLLMFWFGIFFILIGAIFGDSLDSKAFIPKGSGDAILKIGAAILGAGVFAVIMKSSQFTELFQQHILEVFYKPEKLLNIDEIVNRWILLTNALLKRVLPSLHEEASKKIRNQFLNAELQYHFEDLDIEYDIDVDSNENVTITSILKADLVLSPDCDNPIFEQKTEITGEFKLLSLFINDENQNIADMVSDVDNKNTNHKKQCLKFELNKFIDTNNGPRNTVKIEKTTAMVQKLSEEPFIAANFSRYICGANIKAKISEGYSLFFKETGLEDIVQHHKDTNDYDRWMLAESNDLLLPGQGYIIILTKNT